MQHEIDSIAVMQVMEELSPALQLWDYVESATQNDTNAK